MLLKSRYDWLEARWPDLVRLIRRQARRHEKAVDFAQAIRVGDRIDAARLLDLGAPRCGLRQSDIASRNMTRKHLLQGLIKWSTRDRWADRFEQVLEDHLLPACDETGLEIDAIAATVGEDLFMSTVWACAFEDFLTREFDDGGNAIDDYLKRRGWKETASVRAYMAALRNSAMSLYEVSDIVPGTSFRARDLIRAGEPLLISERSATRALKPWDRIAARVVQVGSQTRIGGGVLAFKHETSEAFIEAVHNFEKLGNEKLSDQQRRKLAEAIGQDFDEAAIADLSPTERLQAINPMFTSFWLIDVINRTGAPESPDLRNAEGDEMVLCEVRYPLAAGATDADIGAALEECPEFRRASATSWNWVSQEKPAAAPDADEHPQGSLRFETWREDGALVLGHLELEDEALVLSVNSRKRSDLGRALLSGILGRRVRRPSVKTESFEQIMAMRDVAEPQEFVIPEEERSAIIHDQMDRHYRRVLDGPVPALGGQTPRAAAKTESGRVKVAQWLKIMENRTAKSGEHNSAMASYNFSWLWTELGVSELRR